MEEEFLVECSKCNGKGTLENTDDPLEHVRSCPKCLGAGKLDWVENVVGKENFWGNKISRSSLDNINVRRLLDYVRKAIEGYLSTDIFSNALLKSEELLRHVQSKRGIYEYLIESTPDQKRADIYIKPNRSVEFIHLTMVVQ